MTAESAGISAARPQRAAPWYQVAAHLAGGLIALYGAFLALATALRWAQLQPPGTVIGPPSFVQGLVLSIEQGIYLCVFGSALALGSYIVSRRDARTPAGAQPDRGPVRWRASVLLGAVALVAAVLVLSFVPAPQRIVSLGSPDFQLAPAAADGPFEIYLVSRPFPASAGEDFFPLLSMTLLENATGAIVDRDNLVSSYVKRVSDPFQIPTFGNGFVAPASGSYVVVVRSSFCESLSQPPCANATLAAFGNVTIASPTAYVPAQLGLGAGGSAIVAVAVVQSGLGRRRTTS